MPALKAILGPDGKALVVTKDPVQDKNQLEAFAAKAHEKTEVVAGHEEPEPRDPHGRRRGLAAPDPDRPQGRQVVLRLEGREAGSPLPPHRQKRARRDRGLPRLRRGAARVRAREARRLEPEPVRAEDHQHPGKAGRPRRGATPTGPRAGPSAKTIAEAIAEGYTKKSEPYHGYYFKVLKGQGPAAPLGKMDFVVKGVMIGGFALAAAPADYRVTGVKTFIVSHDGVVYQKDLGPKTLEIVPEDGALQPRQDVEPGRGSGGVDGHDGEDGTVAANVRRRAPAADPPDYRMLWRTSRRTWSVASTRMSPMRGNSRSRIT